MANREKSEAEKAEYLAKKERIAAQIAALPPLGPIAGTDLTVCLAPNRGEVVPTHYIVKGRVDFPNGLGVGPSSVFAMQGLVLSSYRNNPKTVFGTIVNPDGSVYPTVDGRRESYASGTDPNEK